MAEYMKLYDVHTAVVLGSTGVSAADADNSFNSTELFDVGEVAQYDHILVVGFADAANNGTFEVVSATDSKIVVDATLVTEAATPVVSILKQVEVSEKGSFTTPVEFRLRIDLEESDQTRLYVQAEAGYKVVGVEVEPVSANGEATTDKWRLSLDDVSTPSAPAPAGYESHGAPITVGDVEVGDGGKFFWAEAHVTDTEDVQNDATVVLELEGIAEAV